MNEPLETYPVLAEIIATTDLGLSKWYEVVYYDGDKWMSYSGSDTFMGGEKVLRWKYADQAIN